jgi:ADP-heptose:LPS heptosyltransferase
LLNRRHFCAAVTRGRSDVAARLRAACAGDRLAVVIARVCHMGDVMACQPVARHVRVTTPAARIVWVVAPAYRELVEAFPEVDGVVTVGCLTEWLAARRSVGRARVIDLHFNGDECTRCRRPVARTDGDPTVSTWTYLRTDGLLAAFTRAAGVALADDRPVLAESPAAAAAVGRLNLPDRYLVVHTKSNTVRRDWTADQWLRFVRRWCDETGVPVVEVGTTSLLAGAAGVTNLCARLTLPELGEVIRGAAAFVGVESGPAHLANAVDTPGVVLLGKFLWYPSYMPYTGAYARGERCELVYADPGRPATAIPAERVWDALRRLLARTGRHPALVGD